ncbi:unnamed protein product [Moneuplotes crassus]|uniref:Uncharacterized protein n=1 Tax=Euplotes crassus TaxID=5936 RepID=A0AAD1XV05_EUPCR|nr:unnamed protein product [Moneuplotes crassus]
MSKCQIADFHEGFKIKICADHSHQNKQENCTRLGNIGESEEALEVIGACMKSMLVEIETEGNFLDFEEQSFVATRIQKKIVQLIPQLESIKDKSLFQDIKIIEKGIVGIMKELHQSDCFKQFCMRNYMALMCNYLKIDYKKVSRLIKTPFDDDGIQAKLQRVEEEAETLKHDLKKLRERVITTIGLEPQANFQKAYELITNKKLIPSDPKELSFDCACPKDACFMESSDGNVLFNCKELNICRITDNIKLAKDFICSSFPQTVQNFHMNLNGGILDCEEVNDIIVYVGPHVSKEFCIYGMEMSHFQMKNILQTLCKNQRKVGLGIANLN